MARFSDMVLNNYFGPHLSKLTACTAPEIPEPNNYFAAFALNAALRDAEKVSALHVLIANFTRNTMAATVEYRSGRDDLVAYVNALPNHTYTAFHTSAVARFENCILKTYVAFLCSEAIERVVPTAELMPDIKKGELYDRLRLLNNRIKHFDEDVAGKRGETLPDTYPLAPVWITNTGLVCTDAAMEFEELAAYLRDMSAAAHEITTAAQRL